MNRCFSERQPLSLSDMFASDNVNGSTHENLDLQI